MSKKRSDHTLSDLLKLKMSWFYDKNPEKHPQIEYIRTMVQNNAFKGHLKLLDIFPDYQVPEDIPLINKLYFDYYNTLPELAPKQVSQDQINELATIDKSAYEHELENAKSRIISKQNDIDYVLNQIKQSYVSIAQYREIIDECMEKVAFYEQKIAEPATIDQAVIDELNTVNDSEFVIFAIDGSQLVLVSKREIILSYYSNTTRIEVNFGYAVVTFKVKSQFLIDKIDFTNKFFNYGTRHPHVSSSGNICSGDASHIVTNPEQPLFKRLNAIYSVITTYNPSNPYETIEAFKKRTPYFNDTLPQSVIDEFMSKEEQLELKLKTFPKACRDGYRRRWIEENADNMPPRLQELWEMCDDNDYQYNTIVFMQDLMNSTTLEELCNFTDMLTFINYGAQASNYRHLRDHAYIQELRRVVRDRGIQTWHYSSSMNVPTAKCLFMSYRHDTRQEPDRSSNHEYCLPLFVTTDDETYQEIMDHMFTWQQENKPTDLVVEATESLDEVPF